MRYTIITPTLVRPTLARLCESIDRQINGDWEHIIMVDVPLIVMPAKRAIVESFPKDPRRRFYRCGKAHKDYGNTCRRSAWDKAKGDYILYLDDDNYLASSGSLTSLEAVTGEWAIFPLLRHGNRFYNDPPAFSKIDTANMLIRREHAQWPTPPANEMIPNSGYSKSYGADWILAERLLSIPYQALPDLEPVVVMEQTNWGR